MGKRAKGQKGIKGKKGKKDIRAKRAKKGAKAQTNIMPKNRHSLTMRRAPFSIGTLGATLSL